MLENVVVPVIEIVVEVVILTVGVEAARRVWDRVWGRVWDFATTFMLSGDEPHIVPADDQVDWGAVPVDHRTSVAPIAIQGEAPLPLDVLPVVSNAGRRYRRPSQIAHQQRRRERHLDRLAAAALPAA